MDPYFTLKWIHILSSTVLFGTGIGTAFQMVWAIYVGNLHGIHTTARGVVVADYLFTMPAGIVQPLSGFGLVYLTGFSLTDPWLITTYALYLLAFGCWASVVWLQIRIRDMAATACSTDTTLPPRALRYFRIWCALGVPAFLALVAIYWLMITKPLLWG
jgi:uncharacterized membrane protein